jgi:preprotein translocase subunit SecF
MKVMNKLQIRSLLILAVLAIAVIRVTGQSTLPDDLTKNPLKEQFKYLEDRTRIYENYRAIREDMFQKLKANVADTLSAAGFKIAGLNKTLSSSNLKVDSLNNVVGTTKTRLEEMTRTKNSIRVIGMEVNKSAYNSIMWTILVGLIAVLLLGFLVFRRNLSAASNIKKELHELKNEFEAYRKTSREAREKLTMDHFNEIKRLKGG